MTVDWQRCQRPPDPRPGRLIEPSTRRSRRFAPLPPTPPVRPSQQLKQRCDLLRRVPGEVESLGVIDDVLSLGIA